MLNSAPQASNASELIAAYNYAQGKTKKTINISLSTLEVTSLSILAARGHQRLRCCAVVHPVCARAAHMCVCSGRCDHEQQLLPRYFSHDYLRQEASVGIFGRDPVHSPRRGVWGWRLPFICLHSPSHVQTQRFAPPHANADALASNKHVWAAGSVASPPQRPPLIHVLWHSHARSWSAGDHGRCCSQGNTPAPGCMRCYFTLSSLPPLRVDLGKPGRAGLSVFQ